MHIVFKNPLRKHGESLQSTTKTMKRKEVASQREGILEKLKIDLTWEWSIRCDWLECQNSNTESLVIMSDNFPATTAAVNQFVDACSSAPDALPGTLPPLC